MNEEVPPQGATTYATDLEPSYADDALKKIRNAVKGNGVKSEDIELKDFDGEVFEFIATTKLTLATKTSEKIVGGKQVGPRRVDNPHALLEELEKEKQKITSRPDVIKRIKGVILEREDKGFAILDERIKFPFLNTEFMFYEPCNPCNAQGKTKCQRCHGQGYEECTKCYGDGMESCPQCQGNGQISAPQGGYQPCPRCHGHRKISCTLCQQARKVPCSVCKTKGIIVCKQCNGQAWNTHLTIMENDFIGSFDYESEAVPSKIHEVIERLGPKLVKHVLIKPITLAEQPEGDEIIMPYMVRVPHANAVFTVKNEEVPTFLFGTQARLTNVPHFQERIIAPGIKELKLAMKGRGSVEQHLRKAVRYKTIRHAMIAVVKQSKGKAPKTVLKGTPFGISTETAVEIVEMADAALQILTKKPKQIGMIIGMVVGAVLFAGYYLSPAKEIVGTQLPPNISGIAADAAIALIAATVGYLTMSDHIKKARKDVLKNILPKK